jgi:hypothetical protein
MKRAFEQFKKHWIMNLVTFIISLMIAALIFCLMFFLRDRTFGDAVNSVGFATIIILLLGLLSWMAHLGAFDTISFGFKQVGSMLFAKDARRDGSFADYRADKIKKRDNSSFNFIAILLAGILLTIVLIVLEIVYNVKLYSSFS